MSLSEFLNIFYQLYPLVSAVTAMLIAQLIKIMIFYINRGELEIKTLSASGGMPSSHSAIVGGLCTAIGLQDGWTSSTFCICVSFGLVILYDAAGVRRAAGQQAQILNQMIEDLFEKGRFRPTKLTELLGHTPIEVVVGTLLGIGVAFTLYY